MPHEVIMPALGMAQDSGLIVAWHKRPGDAVRAGDVLFEVETDKATMEVEAQADGFVTQIRRHAGDDVPVGEVIALIGDTSEAVHTEESPAGASAPAIEVPKGAEVIMPALGMAQDSGLIVAWHKRPGDAVAASDILFEVETDKSTMEVEAGHDGYIAALLAEAGEDAPVGEAIAVIAAERPASPVQLSRHGRPAAPAEPAEAPNPEPKPTPKAETKAKSGPAPEKPAGAVAFAGGGKVLASPKARRLALEQGLDLARLVKAGIPQPYHVSDLETLKSLPAATAAGVAAGAQHILARVPAEGVLDFAKRLANEGAVAGAVWAAFAAASLRAAGAEGSIVVRLDRPIQGQSAIFADPDLAPLSAIAPAEAEAPQLILRDVTEGRITGVRLGAAEAPVLTVTSNGEDYVLVLDFAGAQLTADVAIQLIEGVAARLDEPLRHLL